VSDQEMRDLVRRVLEGDPAALVALLLMAYRLGWTLEEVLAQLGMTLEQVLEMLGAESAEAREIIRLLRLLDTYRGNTAGHIAKRIAEAINRLKELTEKIRGVRQIWDIVIKKGGEGLYFAGPIAIGLLEVLFIFGAGLLLPASRMGELTLHDDDDRAAWYELIITLYRRHVADREAYRQGSTAKSRTALLTDADYLWRLVQAFRRRYPETDEAAILRLIERAAGGWVRQYLGWDDDDLVRDPPVQAPDRPLPPGRPPALPVSDHPHTVERPLSHDEWVAAQKEAEKQAIRRRIIEVRARLREMMRKRHDPDYDFPETSRMIDDIIRQLLEELEKLRGQLGTDDSGEDVDEPYEPVPPRPAPPWPLGHNWLNPYRLYVNPKTGAQAWISDPPPDGEEWERYDGADGRPRFHWGWVPEVDPETGKIKWHPGWLPGPDPAPRFHGTMIVPPGMGGDEPAAGKQGGG